LTAQGSAATLREHFQVQAVPFYANAAEISAIGKNDMNSMSFQDKTLS
jgi:hypothetical protein